MKHSVRQSSNYTGFTGRLKSVLFICLLYLPVFASAQRIETITATSPDGLTTLKVQLPRTSLFPEDLAVVINTNDSLSVQIGEYYQIKRKIPEQNIIRIAFDGSSSDMTFAVFEPLRTTILQKLTPSMQAVLFTFGKPYRIGGWASLTAAFSLGLTQADTGGFKGQSNLYALLSTAPFTDFGTRPSMLLTGSSFDEVKTIIDRAVSADGSFPSGDGYLVKTTDAVRSSLVGNFEGITNYWNRPGALRFYYKNNSTGSSAENGIFNSPNVLFYFLGIMWPPNIFSNQFVPGSLAHHPTSYGGILFEDSGGHMSILNWLRAGAAASFGTVHEPMASTQKFPDNQKLISRYFTGRTAIEAFWSSIAFNREGLFVGDPLARPFGPAKVAVSNQGALSVITTALEPQKTYRMLAGESTSGPFTTARTPLTLSAYSALPIEIAQATKPVYRLLELNDLTAPTLSFISPPDGTVLSGNIEIRGEVSDTGGVSGISLSIDDMPADFVTTSSYLTSFDTRILINGSHKFSLTGHDTSGNIVVVSKNIQITNTTGPVATPTVTPSSTQTPSPTKTATSTPSPIPTATSTKTPTAAPSATLTPTYPSPVESPRSIPSSSTTTTVTSTTLLAPPSSLPPQSEIEIKRIQNAGAVARVEVKVGSAEIVRAALFFDRSLRASSRKKPFILKGSVTNTTKSTLIVRIRAYRKDGSYLEVVKALSLKKRITPLQSVKATLYLH